MFHERRFQARTWPWSDAACSQTAAWIGVECPLASPGTAEAHRCPPSADLQRHCGADTRGPGRRRRILRSPGAVSACLPERFVAAGINPNAWRPSQIRCRSSCAIVSSCRAPNPRARLLRKTRPRPRPLGNRETTWLGFFIGFLLSQRELMCQPSQRRGP